MLGEYKVFQVPGGFEIFWCPSAPMHYQDRIPHDGKVYSKKQAAYRRVAQLRKDLEARQKPDLAIA
jgi:hypothetical protein